MLVNKEKVGTFKHEPRKSDIIALHDCDIVAEKLCTLLGLDDKLNEVYEKEKIKYSKAETKETKMHEIEDKLKEEAHLKEDKHTTKVDKKEKQNDANDKELEQLIDKLKI